MATKALRYNPICWLFAFIVLQLLVWSLTPYLLVKGMYVDILENIEWGRHWQWGYDKNPYFGAWLSYAIYYLTHRSFLSLYLTSQISVVVAWFAVWRLATRLLPSLPALVSTLGLIAIGFYSGITVELNDNVIEISLWALTCLFFYDAVTKQRYRDWSLTGLCVGLAAMTKYYTLMLLLAMLIFLLVNPMARRSFARLGLYLGALVFLVITIPNLIWLINNDFITITYAFGRAGMYKNLYEHIIDHIFNPLLYLVGTALFGLPLYLVIKYCFKEKDNYSLTAFNKHYIYLMCFGPFLLSVLFSMITGARMIFMWSTPLFNLFGIYLVSYFKPVISWQSFRRFVIIVSCIFVVYFLGFVYVENIYPYTFNAAAKQNIFEIFPGAELANTLTQQWHARYHQPLKYVAGDRFYTLNLAAYSPDHPVAYFDWDSKKSPWIDERDLQKSGAIVLWDKPTQQTLPANIKQRFPNIVILPIYKLAHALPIWPQTLLGLKVPPDIRVGFAFIPPAKISGQ